jgi:hypothetical protein
VPPTRSRPPRLHTARSADHRSCGLSRQWRQGPPRAGLVMHVVGGRHESSYPARPALCSTLRFKRRRARASGNCRLGSTSAHRPRGGAQHGSRGCRAARRCWPDAAGSAFVKLCDSSVGAGAARRSARKSA